MKKRNSVLCAAWLCLLLVLTGGIYVFGVGNTEYATERASDTGDFDELYRLRGEVAGGINSVLERKCGELGFSVGHYGCFEAEDIDPDGMYRVWIASEKFENALSGDEGFEALVECEYVWVLPVQFEDFSVTVTLDRRGGEWNVSAVSSEGKSSCFEDATVNAGIGCVKNGTVYFVRFPWLNTEAAVLFAQEESFVKTFSDLSGDADAELRHAYDYGKYIEWRKLRPLNEQKKSLFLNGRAETVR
ncbi:MAG: hypothetical protein PUA83_01865 [Clostridiales bacterium]|nr:hypothetical protein [Clostridiales bacterium]